MHFFCFVKKRMIFELNSLIIKRIYPKLTLHNNIEKDFTTIRYNSSEFNSKVIEKIFFTDLLCITSRISKNADLDIPNTICLHSHDGNSDRQFLGTLKKFKEGLPEAFIQISQSYIINKNYIRVVSSDNFLMLKGLDKRIPIGRKFKSNLPKEYLDF